jgi:FkbM family methyltransferase
MINAIPLGLYCKGVNSRRAVQGYPYRIRPFGEDQIHVAYDVAGSDRKEIHICRRTRHRRYKSGVYKGVTNLARQYQLDLLPIVPGGVFIDCGANVGELGIWARSLGLDYVAFEPEPLEARCCDLNNFGCEPRTIRKALWYEATTLNFFSKPDTADSSVFEINDPSGNRSVEAVRLDAVVDPSAFGVGTRIFKLEAEGAEPEILQGAEGILPHLDYVAADCGYERGKEARHTFIEVHDFMLDRGFRLIHAEFNRITAIYRNDARIRPA